MGDLDRTVVVIGGGPAGLSAAIAARLKGFEVTVMDCAQPPIDKACGEGVLPAGVEALRRLGVDMSGGGCFRFRGIRFLDQGTEVEARFTQGSGLAMRRSRLHEILARRARDLGVRLVWGRHVILAEPSRRGWMIGADGLNSGVRRAAGLDQGKHGSPRYGFRRHYGLTPWADVVEVHWNARCQVYVTPVSDGEIGVAVVSRDPHLRLDAALTDFPDLRRRLQGAQASDAERGALTVPYRLRRVSCGQIALIGDAAGSVDAITGDGLSLSFQHALALADALCAGDLEQYQCEHRRLMRRPVMMETVLLLLDRLPAVRRAAMRILALEPPIFARLLSAHAGGHSAPSRTVI
jgi:flavin-dependent dehydrogenase